MFLVSFFSLNAKNRHKNKRKLIIMDLRKNGVTYSSSNKSLIRQDYQHMDIMSFHKVEFGAEKKIRTRHV